MSKRTDIDFLKELGEDLMEAAWRESFAPSNVKTRRPHRRRSRRRIVSLAAAASLVLAGGVGYLSLQLTRHSSVNNAAGGPQASHRLRGQFAPVVPAPSSVAGSFTGGGAFGPPSTGGTISNVDELARGSNSIDARRHLAAGGPSTPTNSELIKQTPELAQVVKTASLDLELPRNAFGADYQKATGIAARFGGFVQSSSTSGNRSGSLLIRVPAGKFEFALGAIRHLGRVQFQTVVGRDVTSQFIDLNARLQIARARRGILLKLQGQATTIGETLQLQNVIDDTQLTIEQIQGQLRYLSRQTTFGTIHLDMHEKGAPVRRHHKRPAATIHTPSFTRGLRHAVAGFAGVVVAVVVGLGYMIPIAVLGLIVWLVIRRARRARTA